jgi:septal ring factor EnvC (AmiA/AmiB activator)
MPPARDEVVDAVVAAVLERLAPHHVPPVDTDELDRAREALRETKEELAAAKAALERLTSQPPPPDTGEVDRAREALREAKEELAAANAEIDQNRQRIRALEAELGETRVVAEKASARLREVARLLLRTEEHAAVEP